MCLAPASCAILPMSWINTCDWSMWSKDAGGSPAPSTPIASCTRMSVSCAIRMRLSERRVSPEKVTEPYSVSNRNAYAGNTGPCGTSVA